MEGLCYRFPHVTKMILKDLDDQSMIKSMEANREVENFLSNDKIYWTRVLANYNTNFILFRDSWRRCLHQVPVIKIQEMALAAQEFFKRPQSRLKFQWSPLHIAAHIGSLEFYKYISRKCERANSVGDHGVTAIHMAARAGHLEIVRFIIENLQDQNQSASPCRIDSVPQLTCGDHVHKNPRNADGVTPLHLAALNGHFETCAFIIKLVTNSNPKDKNGNTPLHGAAKRGHLQIYKLIMKYLVDKNPANNVGWTPLHVASSSNQLEAIKLIMCHVQNKNPESIRGFTPLQVAIELGHLEVVKLFVGHLDVKILGDDSYTSLHSAAKYCNPAISKLLIENSKVNSPTGRNGWTPLDYAAINGHFAICALLCESLVERRSFNNVRSLGHFSNKNGNCREISKDLNNLGAKTIRVTTPLELMALNLSQCKEFLECTYYNTRFMNRTGSLEGTLETPWMKHTSNCPKSHDLLALFFQQCISPKITTERKILGFFNCHRMVQNLFTPYFSIVMHQLIYELVHTLQ